MKTSIAGKYSRADQVVVSGFDMKQTRIPTAAVIALFLLAVSVDVRTEPGTDARGSAQDPAVETEAQPEFDPDRHEQPIIEENGRLLLWASEDTEGNFRSLGGGVLVELLRPSTARPRVVVYRFV